MNKQELIKMLNRTIEDYTNKDGFGRGVRTGLSMATFAIKRLDEPEKVVVPRFVADWWDGDSVTMYGGERINKRYKLRLISNFHDRGLGDYLSKVEDWLDENDTAFLDLVNGKPYEVEKEKLYRVLDKEGCVLVKKYTDGTSLIKSTGIKPERFPEWQQNDLLLTEQEIKDYDERLWPFAVEVAE